METNLKPLTSRPNSIFSGVGLHRDILAGREMMRVPEPQPPLRIPPPCPLLMSQASTESGFAVTFSFGTIARRRPTGFNTEGLITPKPVANDGAEHNFFAKATLDPTTLQWSSAEIVEAAWDVANTNTEHYTLIGIAKVVDNKLVLSTSNCRNIEPEICELASTITP